jgi:hypothetical protein
MLLYTHGVKDLPTPYIISSFPSLVTKVLSEVLTTNIQVYSISTSLYIPLSLKVLSEVRTYYRTAAIVSHHPV